MRTLLILRHAKSSWSDARLSDHERPLKERGLRDATRVGRLLRQEDLVPELIISSTAVRARETAELVAETAGYEGEIEWARSFYHAAPEDYVERLQELNTGYQPVMIVGHNPGMAELVADLSGEEVALPTAALAQIELPVESWQELRLTTEGVMVNLWQPRELP